MRASKLRWLLMGMLCLVLWPVVVTAHRDWRVGQAQERLKAAGFNPGPIDGVLGPRTKTALRRYQASHRLPETGVLDKATRQSLVPSGLSQRDEEGKTEPWLKAPPGGNYKKVSSLVQLPDEEIMYSSTERTTSRFAISPPAMSPWLLFTLVF